MRILASALIGAAAFGLSTGALAAPPASAAGAPADETAKPAPPAPPAPYAIPWQLRGLPAATLIRSDNSLAFYENPAARHGLTYVQLLTGSLRIPHTGPKTAGLSIWGKGTIVDDVAPGGTSGFAVVNPALGAAYAFKFDGGYRLAMTLGATVPVGNGGGDNPNAKRLQARLAAPAARSQMDGTLFNVNDFSIISGVDVGWVDMGWTVQAEASVYEFIRVRGETKQAEASKTNFTSGIFVGYFVSTHLSLGAEVRYQHWINAPFSVENDTTGRTNDNLTVAGGPRVHIPLPGKVWLRPGVAYGRALDRPMASAALNYHIIQLDIPVLF